MIVLAGGSGHLGSVLCELVAARDVRVRVISRDPVRARSRIPGGVEIISGDVRRAPSLTAAFAGVDTVISAVTGFGPGGAGPRKVDLEGNINLIQAASAAGAKHFILVSIYGARPDHPMELYRAKFMAEERLKESRLEWTIIRPTAFLELWSGIVGDPLVKSGAAIVLGRGENPINFVSARDVARVVEQAVLDQTMRGRTVDVGGPQNLSLNQLVGIVADRSGRKAKARHIPLSVLRLGAAALRPFRPDIAGLLQAAVLMDTSDMRYVPGEVEAFDRVHSTRLADIADRQSEILT